MNDFIKKGLTIYTVLMGVIAIILIALCALTYNNNTPVDWLAWLAVGLCVMLTYMAIKHDYLKYKYAIKQAKEDEESLLQINEESKEKEIEVFDPEFTSNLMDSAYRVLSDLMKEPSDVKEFVSLLKFHMANYDSDSKGGLFSYDKIKTYTDLEQYHLNQARSDWPRQFQCGDKHYVGMALAFEYITTEAYIMQLVTYIEIVTGDMYYQVRIVGQQEYSDIVGRYYRTVVATLSDVREWPEDAQLIDVQQYIFNNDYVPWIREQFPQPQVEEVVPAVEEQTQVQVEDIATVQEEPYQLHSENAIPDDYCIVPSGYKTQSYDLKLHRTESGQGKDVYVFRKLEENEIGIRANYTFTSYFIRPIKHMLGGNDLDPSLERVNYEDTTRLGDMAFDLEANKFITITPELTNMPASRFLCPVRKKVADAILTMSTTDNVHAIDIQINGQTVTKLIPIEYEKASVHEFVKEGDYIYNTIKERFEKAPESEWYQPIMKYFLVIRKKDPNAEPQHIHVDETIPVVPSSDLERIPNFVQPRSIMVYNLVCDMVGKSLNFKHFKQFLETNGAVYFYDTTHTLKNTLSIEVFDNILNDIMTQYSSCIQFLIKKDHGNFISKHYFYLKSESGKWVYGSFCVVGYTDTLLRATKTYRDVEIYPCLHFYETTPFVNEIIGKHNEAIKLWFDYHTACCDKGEVIGVDWNNFDLVKSGNLSQSYCMITFHNGKVQIEPVYNFYLQTNHLSKIYIALRKNR